MVVTKNAKGFTLVELMIVVAIIGVLATTLLPVLNGAQERARDGGRIASMNNIATALATFNSDQGVFPKATTATNDPQDTGYLNCLSNSSGSTSKDLAMMLKGGVAPLDPQRQNIIRTSAPVTICNQAGSYAYFPLNKNGVAQASFGLIGDVETNKRANYNINGAAAPDGQGDSGTDNDYATWVKDTGTRKIGPVADSVNSKDAVYAIFN